MATRQAIMTEDPQALLRLAELGRATGLALAARKIPDGLDPDSLTDAQMLEATAWLLDRLDDATDAYRAAHGRNEPGDRTMQQQLRRIAAQLDGKEMLMKAETTSPADLRTAVDVLADWHHDQREADGSVCIHRNQFASDCRDLARAQLEALPEPVRPAVVAALAGEPSAVASWHAEYKVHPLQHDDEWTSVPVHDEAEGRQWLDRWREAGVVIAGRVVRVDRTVVHQWESTDAR
jgi:hypothetical protein